MNLKETDLPVFGENKKDAMQPLHLMMEQLKQLPLEEALTTAYVEGWRKGFWMSEKQTNMDLVIARAQIYRMRCCENCKKEKCSECDESYSGWELEK